VILNVNFKTLSSLINSAFVGVGTLQISKYMVQQLKKMVVLKIQDFWEKTIWCCVSSYRCSEGS